MPQLWAQWMTVPLMPGPLAEASVNQPAWATCLPVRPAAEGGPKGGRGGSEAARPH